jgi:hypothetical protein
MRACRTVSIIALAFVATACGGEEQSTSAPGYYEAVKPILDARCVTCHESGGIGPVALTSYAHVANLAPLIRELVSSRTMPPWAADSGYQQYKFDPSLSDEQIATIAAWADAGAPEGDPTKEGAPLDIEKQTLARVDATIGMAAPYTPTRSPDEYRCFIIDWPRQDSTWVTGFDAKPGNPSIDHHIAAYLVTPDNPLGPEVFDELAALDAAEPEPGYTCFGGPSGDSELNVPAQQLGQWVPGQGGGDFPGGTGILVPAGSKIVLQMHYNLLSGVAPDHTMLDVMIDSAVDKPAGFAPWLDVNWVFGSMDIPAGEPEVVHNLTDDPRDFFTTFIPHVDTSQGFLVHAVMLHMHKLGVSGTVAIERQDGTRDVLLSVSRYDFNWQRLYQFVEPIQFHPGDKLTVECRWNNSPEHQPVIDGMKQAPRHVNWGEGTYDEMCVGNLYVSEP